MVNFDPTVWVMRAQSFFQRLRARKGRLEKHWELTDPITERDLLAVERRLPRKLPDDVRTFFLRAAGRIDMHYEWVPTEPGEAEHIRKLTGERSIVGGLRIGPVQDMIEAVSGVPDDREYDKLRQDLAFMVPLLHFGDGDQLCLDMRAEGAYPITFAAHDSMFLEGWDWREVAPSLTEFLSAWESVCYVRDIYLSPVPVARDDGSILGGPITGPYFADVVSILKESCSW